ncbi:MAG: host attachment protein [Halothiobacillaceae bacterium]
MQMKTWVIVADAARARFLRVTDNAGAYRGSAANPSSRPMPKGALEEVEELLNPAGRSAGADLVTDRPGATSDRKGEALHAYEPHTSPRDVEAQRFAQQVVQALEQAQQRGRMERFYLVAAPRFLGMLREKLGNGLKQAMVADIAKDYSAHQPEAIRAALPRSL